MIQKNNIQIFLIGSLVGVLLSILVFYLISAKRLNLINDKNDKLKDEITQIQKERDEIQKKREIDSLSIINIIRERDSLDNEIKIIEGKISKREETIRKFEIERNELKKKILALKNTPNNKSGEELLISIKEKIK